MGHARRAFYLAHAAFGLGTVRLQFRCTLRLRRDHKANRFSEKALNAFGWSLFPRYDTCEQAPRAVVAVASS